MIKLTLKLSIHVREILNRGRQTDTTRAVSTDENRYRGNNHGHTPNPMMMINILKNTRNTWFRAKAIGMIPKNVVVAPTTTDGPISPIPSAIRTSFGVLGSCERNPTEFYRGGHQTLHYTVQMVAGALPASISICETPLHSIVYIRSLRRPG